MTPLKDVLLNPEVRPFWNRDDEAQLLDAYERVWNRKVILRRLYETWYEKIAAELQQGSIIEVGAGTGNFKRWLQTRGRACWTLDILPGKYVDVQADALQMPLAAGSVDNIVMVDALHHFARPLAFLKRAAEVLRPHGRLLLIEPFASVWGRFVYRYLHHEHVDFDFEESTASKNAWDGNAAVPQLALARVEQEVPEFRIKRLNYCEFLAYPLSGGFSYRSLLPSPLLLALHWLEQSRLFQNRTLSLRVIAVLEKTA